MQMRLDAYREKTNKLLSKYAHRCCAMHNTVRGLLLRTSAGARESTISKKFHTHTLYDNFDRLIKMQVSTIFNMFLVHI